MTEDIKQSIVDAYMSYLREQWSAPSYSDMLMAGISRDQIRHHFGNISNLREFAIKENQSEDVLFVKKLFESINPLQKKRFVITTAVANSRAHVDMLNSLDNYCDRNDAQVIIMPCESKVNSFQNESAIFDPEFSIRKYFVVSEDTNLNENLFLCSIQVSANQIKPITGLTRIGAREGSYVFASPKQFLDYAPTGTTGKNYTVMTPGACTLPNYFDVKTFISKRLSYIANHDHTMGGIIVDVIDDKKFHFRQFQVASDGSFIDLGTRYNSDGSIDEDRPVTLVLGDLHGVQVDEQNLDAFIAQFSGMNIDNVVLHDTFDGQSISHHIKDPGPKASRVYNNLADELFETATTVKHIQQELNPSNIIIVKSNHDEVIDRWISEARYINEPENYRLGHELAIIKHDKSEDVLKAGMLLSMSEYVEDLEAFMANWIFLQRDQSFKVAGVELAAHGDLGSNGSRATLAQLEKIYGDCVTGHAHSAAIQRKVFRVGTFSLLRMDYNRGPSSWTQTGCLVNEDGSRQLVNNVGGAFF